MSSISPADRDSNSAGIYGYGTPCEAVDPRTVKPKVAGELTARAAKNHY